MLAWYGDSLSKLAQLTLEYNPKGQLQERLHARKVGDDIHYQVTSERGPPHDKTFEVELSIQGKSMAKATGKRKKEAEERAARQILDKFESWSSQRKAEWKLDPRRTRRGIRLRRGLRRDMQK